MEALFYGYHVGDMLHYDPPARRNRLQRLRVAGSGRTRGWSKTTRVYLTLYGPAATVHYLEQPKTTPAPLTPQENKPETQKCRRRRGNALRRFLVTSAMIGCNYAPDFDGANPHGVH